MDTFKNDAVKSKIRSLSITEVLDHLDKWRTLAAVNYNNHGLMHEKCLKNIKHFSAVLDSRLSG